MDVIAFKKTSPKTCSRPQWFQRTFTETSLCLHLRHHMHVRPARTHTHRTRRQRCCRHGPHKFHTNFERTTQKRNQLHELRTHETLIFNSAALSPTAQQSQSMNMECWQLTTHTPRCSTRIPFAPPLRAPSEASLPQPQTGECSDEHGRLGHKTPLLSPAHIP
jgi:hypothetical protein